jgi:hypothetical protein
MQTALLEKTSWSESNLCSIVKREVQLEGAQFLSEVLNARRCVIIPRFAKILKRCFSGRCMSLPLKP